jgi:hypothetical protein
MRWSQSEINRITAETSRDTELRSLRSEVERLREFVGDLAAKEYCVQVDDMEYNLKNPKVFLDAFGNLYVAHAEGQLFWVKGSFTHVTNSNPAGEIRYR